MQPGSQHNQQSKRHRTPGGWLIGIAVLLSIVSILVYIGYSHEWTGFGQSVRFKGSTQDLRREKTLWDWLQLLVVPAALAGFGIWFNWRQTRLEDKRKEHELGMEQQRAQDAALQAYYDQMSSLLIDRSLRSAPPGTDRSEVARARTLTVLKIIDGNRKSHVLQFLYETGLINNGSTVIKLAGADLNGAHLSRSNLEGANLQEVSLQHADLRGAILKASDLQNADLQGADLAGYDVVTSTEITTQPRYAPEDDNRGVFSRWWNFRRTRVIEGDEDEDMLVQTTDLSKADLRGAHLRDADLSSAKLSGADLRNANLRNAILTATNLEGADLRDAINLTQEQLEDREVDKPPRPFGIRGRDYDFSSGAGGDHATKLPKHLKTPKGWTS